MEKKFYYKDLEFAVFDSVYDPSDDSLLLAGSVKEKDAKGKAFLDLGCGSGIQGINALALGAKKVLFADIDEQALDNAKANAKKLGFEKCSAFKKSNLFFALKERKFDLIVFNPPYAESTEKKWLDVDGGKKGRELLDRFLKQLKNRLKKNGTVFFVQSSLNGKARTKRLLKEQGFAFEIVARKRLFFEELIVFRAWAL